MIRCPKCGHEFARQSPGRVCGRCKKPITRHHKWRIVNSRIEHRNCSDPKSYEPPTAGRSGS